MIDVKTMTRGAIIDNSLQPVVKMRLPRYGAA